MLTGLLVIHFVCVSIWWILVRNRRGFPQHHLANTLGFDLTVGHPMDVHDEFVVARRRVAPGELQFSNKSGSNAGSVFVGTRELTPKYGSSFSAMSARRTV